MKWMVFFLALGVNLAYADSGKAANSGSAKWKEECSSCHIPYPPQLLSADSWKQLMGGLDKHFGSNAGLDPKDRKAILTFLEKYSDNNERYRAASLRISDTPWFRREHHVISDQEWINPEVRSRSNCSACHINVGFGDWS